MKKYLFFIMILSFGISCTTENKEYRTISIEVLKDKIAGGWAGKMIGVTYGFPTEFVAQGHIFEDSIRWTPDDIDGSLWQDDLYVQLSFMMTMHKPKRITTTVFFLQCQVILIIISMPMISIFKLNLIISASCVPACPTKL